MRARLRTAINLEESVLLPLIPTRTGFIAVDCPNCDEGVQGNQLDWTIDEPTVLTCRYCGHRYPSSKYPDDRVLEVKDPLGRMQQYPYYQDASGRRYFFQARLWRLARNYFEYAVYDLAQIFHYTGQPALARRTVVILDRFAQLYPGFIVVRESQQDDQGFQDESPYETQGGKWGRWYYDEMPTGLILAYDLIYDSGELAALSVERGLDVRQRIEEDFFRGAVRHVRTYPELYTNASPAIYRGLAALGRVINEPDYVHDAVQRVRGLLENGFFFDGFWKEGSANYHRMTLRGLDGALTATDAYSDPAGYVDPTDGTRFDNLNLRQQIPVLALALKTTDRFCYPDGRLLPVHDSWTPAPQPAEPPTPNPADNPYRRSGTPLAFSAPALWAGVGHAYLGRGKGPDQMQAHLHFGGAYGHAHDDNLNLMLFALGEELLPDLGYSHTRYRYWTRSTLAHNTVMVDGWEQYSGTKGAQFIGPKISYPRERAAEADSAGNLLLFASAGDDFQVVEASGEAGYPGLVSTYRRCLLIVGIDERRAYVVDLFEVAGGESHEWVLHGSADRDQQLSVNAPLSPYSKTLLPADVEFVPPSDEYQTGTAGGHNPAYGFVRDVQRGPAPAVLVATFQSVAKGASLRIHSPTPTGSEVLTGRGPSLRRAGENDARVEDFWMPVLILRSAGRNQTRTFMSVMEPFATAPAIRRVERIKVLGGGHGLHIEGDGWTDHLIHRGPDQPVGETIAGKVRLRGRIGWVRERGGKMEAMCLVGGSELSFGDQRLNSFGTLSGRVIRVLRRAAGDTADALQVEGDIPAGTKLDGLTVIVRHGDGTTHGYSLTGLRRAAGNTLLLLSGEPGFEIDDHGSTRFLFFPKRVIGGEVTYLVHGLSFLRA